VTAIRIVGAVLVRNEDLYVEQAVRNAARICDAVHVADNESTDRTWEILERIASELPHVDVRRVADIGSSHGLVERYAGTDTWVFGVDGDELYDPAGLEVLAGELRSGMYHDRYRIKSNVLNCVAVDAEAGTATGYLAPPSRPMTKLFNFAAVERWDGPAIQLLHGGTRVFRPGYDQQMSENVGDRLDWETSYFRCLHCCFVPRSSAEDATRAGGGRLSPVEMHELGSRRRGLPLLWRRARRSSSSWKNEKYRRGPLVTVDARPFFAGDGPRPS
jgi:hypothetical protein